MKKILFILCLLISCFSLRVCAYEKNISVNKIFAAQKTSYENVVNAEMYCDSLDLLLQDIEGAFNLFKVVAPIFVVVMSTYDFIKAITGKVDGDMKKAFTKLMKRFAFAIILFFLPIILNFCLGLWDPNYSTCIAI